MDKYRVTITGAMDLLMHADNIEWRDAMEAWNKDPENRKVSKAGDDRTPAWRWLGALYHDGHFVGIPSDNLMTAIREAGAKVPTGKGQATFKKASQSGILVNEVLWPLMIGGKPLAFESIEPLREESDFAVHAETAKKLGFELFVKSVRIGQAKHIRVRPRFHDWSASGTISVLDEAITPQILEKIWNIAGQYCGLCDWRPSASKAPGPWGTFTVTLKKEK
jgi:hypothetical protein